MTALASQPARIASVLGLPAGEGFDDVALADRVSSGLAPAAAQALATAYGDAARLLGGIVPEATLRRARKQRRPLSREMSERLYEMARVRVAAVEAYGGDEAGAGAFLTRPHPLLGGRTPLEVARASSAGADAVVRLLRRAEAGFAV